ncbi:flavin containing amine oxidoreductase [Colletotrichum graminicola M1.001]|uniref:Amine oxidase n=1 Tax=Colletotrichum graminicola (strain M1.001 / M2 / FGSC 10212) TaxID=645133 RepID=E3QQA6_COLGM|nr:flavin containing amine oxidoreductase [Colletotrichum graminicola M1.001]EFQ33044.1 flavin containing amine oxidoreductase [Colletotrichum graminicola M1.001]
MYDCVVIGAGYSGLAAARLLKDSGKHILVLEALDRVGGRAKTIPHVDGEYWDVGASFLGDQQDLMYGLATEFNVPLHTAATNGKIVLTYRGKARGYSGLLPPMQPWEVLDMKLCESVNLEKPWLTPDAEKLDRITVHGWLKKGAWTQATIDMGNLAFETTIGQNTSCISMLHAMFFFKGVVNFTSALSSENGAQKHFILGGGQAIASKPMDYLGDEIVHLEEPVRKISYSESVASIRTDKTTYRTRRIISAIPPGNILKIEFEPRLPIEKESLLQNMPMGSLTKFYATYKKPFWRERDLTGESTNPDGFIGVTFDASQPSGFPAKLMGFVGSTKSREFMSFSKDKRRHVALGGFAAAFGQEALDPEDFFCHNMMEENWSSGCPTATPSPGMWSLFGQWMRKPVEVIHWAGTETSTKHYGYMEGAVFAGQRSAREILEELKWKI